MIDFSIIKRKPATPCWPLIRSPLIRLPSDRTKQSPGEDRRVGWYCYRATQSRRSHLTYTHRKSSYRPKEISFGKKLAYARAAALGLDPSAEICRWYGIISCCLQRANAKVLRGEPVPARHSAPPPRLFSLGRDLPLVGA